MIGYKVIIKAKAEGFSNIRLEDFIKNTLEGGDGKVKVEHIKAKVTQVMEIRNATSKLEKTIVRRNGEICNLEQRLNQSETKVVSLESQVSDLLRIIRDREVSTCSDDFCNCGDWRSVGSDPISGDKLKRCNICERVGVR